MRRNLARSYDGKTIHRADCRHARVPWRIVDDVDDDFLLQAKLALGYRVCKVCKPSFRSTL